MNRLTYKTMFGDYGGIEEYENSYTEICALRNTLGKYEDLGYSPEELGQILKEKVSSESSTISEENDNN